MNERPGPPVPCPACGGLLRPETAGRTRCVCGVESRVFRFHPFRAAGASRAAPAAAGTPCAYHSGNAAVTACARCGSFLCEICATPVGGATYCTACFERLRAGGDLGVLRHRIPRPHAVALASSLLTLVPLAGLLFLPVVAWQGIVALRRYSELEERESGIPVYLALAGLLSLGGLALTVALLRAGR